MKRSSGAAIYLFWSEADASVFGFTVHPMGANLPDDFAPWIKNGDGGAIYVGEPGNVSSIIISDVLRDGFYLASVGPRATHLPGSSIH